MSAALKVTREVMTREHWREYVTRRCMLHATLCDLVPEGTTDLGRLPSHVIELAQAKVHELVALGLREDEAGESRMLIGQQIETQLWRLLYDFRPAVATPQAINATG